MEAAHSVLYGIFDEGVDGNWLEANPASKVLKRILPPKNERDQKEPDPFDRTERDLFLETATSVCSRSEMIILQTMTHGGLRLGESLAMRVGGLDLRKRTYHVTQTFKEYVYEKPKTKMSRRCVDLPDFLVEDLKRHILLLRQESLQAGKGGEVDLLFPDPAERWKWPYSQRKVQGIVKKVCRKAGLRQRNPHDLRHTYASIMLMAHQSPAYVQKQLGHSSISITVDVYGHWISGEGRNGLEEALKPSVQESHIIAYEQEWPR